MRTLRLRLWSLLLAYDRSEGGIMYKRFQQSGCVRALDLVVRDERLEAVGDDRNRGD